MNTSEPNLPNYTRPEVVATALDLGLVHDLLAGTRRMWDQSQVKAYIRKWKDEDGAVYNIRRQCETLFEGLNRVLSASVGMLFAKAPQMEWNQSEVAMTEHWANLDGAGTAGPVLVKRFSEQALRDGLGIILVDHPTPPDGVVVTEKNEIELGLRPTWALYGRASAINWFDDIVKNQRILTQLTLCESATVRQGVYGIKRVQRYRDLRLVLGPDGDEATWTLREETETAGQGGFKVVGSGVFRNRKGQMRNSLPVAIAYTGRSDAILCATIPLMGVAWANLSHWQQSTNLRFYRDLAAFPQPVVVGQIAQEVANNGATTPGRIKVGPMAGMHLNGEGASFSWVAPPTEAFEPLERGIKEKLEQIGQQGMSFMVSDTRAAETAEAKRLDATAENSTLATAAQGIDDAINAALEIHAWYLGIEKAGAPVFTLCKDFESTAMDPQTMAVYVDAIARAGLPPRIMLQAWQQGGRIPPDVDLDELEMEILTNIDAQKQADAQAQKDQANRFPAAA